MSLLPLKSHITTRQPAFIPYYDKLIASTISTGTLTANLIEAEAISTTLLSAYAGTFSTFSTSQIVIDSQTLNATPTELLLNGVPVATASSLSSIADWAIDPAISTVQMNGNNLLGASTISCITMVADQGIVAANLQVGNGIFNNLVAFNSLFVSSNTSTISSLVLNAELGTFSTISSGTVNATLMNVSTLEVSGLISTPDIEVSSINGAQFTTDTIKVDVGSFSSLVANSLSSVGAQIREALISTIVFSPSLNPSLGGVNVNLGLGGVLGNVIGWGAGVMGAGTGIVALGTSMAAIANGRQTNYIDSSRYELVNGTTQLQFSTIDVPFSTIYRFNNSADPERTPGEEVFISTVNAPGVAVRSVSDPLNTLSSPSSTIQAFGQWVPVPAELVNVSSFQEAFISSLTVSTLLGADNIVNVGISTFVNGGATVPDGAGAVLEQFQQVNTYNVATDQLASYFSSVIEVANDMTYTSGSGINTNFLNDTGRAFVSSLSTATIEAANPNLFGLGVQGLTIQTAAGGQVFISSAQTNTQGLLNASSISAFETRSRSVIASSITTSTLEFSQAGAYGLSSLMFLSTAQLPGFGTSTTVYMNTDMSLGQNDFFCQQIRLGYLNPSSQPSEIVFHSPNNTQRAFNLGNSDQTIRLQSTANATTAGYILDTQVNPPFFSTINQSTALMAWFPSTTSGTIGVSTISFQPPKVVAGAFTSLSTQVVPAADTPFAIAYTNTDYAAGGMSFSTTAIVIPQPGIYETGISIQLDKSGGGVSPCDFWLRKNGVDVPNSASQTTIQGTAGEVLATVTLILPLTTGDKLEVVMASSDATMAATFFQSTVTTPYTRPAIPSLIVNIKCLNY